MSYPPESPNPLLRPGVPDRDRNVFASDADVTVYWPWVRPAYDAAPRGREVVDFRPVEPPDKGPNPTRGTP